ncbi:hypothetical protein ACF0H5_021136 [Mactra antiquata]
MTRTKNYDVQTAGSHDNPVFTVDIPDTQTQQEQTTGATDTTVKDLKDFDEIPHSGKTDYIKFGVILTFILAMFVLAIAVTGSNV